MTANGQLEELDQQAIMDFFKDPETYVEASKNTDTPLSDETMASIGQLMKDSPEKAVAAIAKNPKLVANISKIFKSKKTKLQKGGLIAYLRCLMKGGVADNDCHCKSVKAK